VRVTITRDRGKPATCCEARLIEAVTTLDKGEGTPRERVA